jgi:enamine deaminase RidA (YjgF/YER057c/UK114 family)
VSGADARLTDLGLVLPAVPAPAAAYQPWVRHRDLVVTAGQLPVVEGALPRTGKLGADLATEEGAALAKRAALNVLAIAREAAEGDLDRVRVLKLTVFVACTPDFTEQHLVANGASDLIGEVLGDAGLHARSAVGVSALPLDSPVEVEAFLALA